MLHPNLNFGNIRQNNLLDLLKQRRSEIREAVKTVISSFTAEQTTAKLIQIMNDFSSGNANLEATLSELEKLWITPQVSVEGTKAVISFEYNGKNYTIQYIAPEPTTEPTPEPEVTSDNAENPPTNPVVDEPEEPVSDESNQTQVVESPLTEKTPDENTPEELALAELIENYEDKENIESFDEITKLLDAIGIEFSIVSEGDNTKSITFEFNNVTYTFYNTVETTLPEPKEPVVDEPIVEEPVADEPDEPDAAGGRRVGPNRLVDGDTLGVNSNSEITTPGTNKKEQALKQAITEFLEELDEIETTGYNFARHLDSVQLSSLKEYLEKLNDKETYPNLELKIEFKEDNLCDIYLKENGEYVYSVDDLDAEQVRGIITSKEAPIETSKTDADIIANLLKETIPDIDSAKVQAMIDDLTSMAESKGVDPTEYVDARLIDFLVMRAENPNLTLDEMNETLALNDVLDLSLNSLVPTVSELFSTDITSFEDLLEFQNWEKLLIDEYPQAREAYIQTSRMTYLTLAQDGELTKGDYYELIKLDLANIFPDFDELDDADRAEVTNKINSLSPEQVEYFINKAIELPGCYQDGYDEALNNFFDEFDGSVSGSAYSLSNSDELITLSEVYTSISGIEFNPDSIIEANTKLEKIEEAINESVTYQTALNIFDAVDNGSKDIGSALWQIGCLYTGSIEDEDIAQFLREITGNNDIYVENGTVVISQSAMVRGNGKQNGSTQDNSVLDSVKDYCKDTFKGVVDLCVSQSVQDTWNNSDLTTIDGFINFADNLLSDPNFYEDLGKGLLVGAGIAATGGLGTGVLITGSIGASAVASGATCEFLQRCKAEGEVTSDNITNFAATLGEAALDFYGVKTAGLAFELPSAMKGILNKVTSGVKSTINQIVDKFPNIKQNLAKNFSGVLSKSLTAEEQSAFIKKYGFISGEEKIRDGLVIEGATQVGKNYVSKATQNTIVDRTKDSFLNKMIDEIKILTQGKSDKEKADIIQDYILKICNGKGTQYTALRSESLPNNILLGEVFEKYPESAVCRHRATLFKVLADEVDLKVTLQAGQKTFFGMDGSLGYIDERFGNYANHIWNYVKINNKSYIFDPMTGDILDINKTTKTLFKDFYGDINGVQLYNRPATMRLKRIAASVTTLLAAAGAVAQNQTPEVPPTQPNNPQPTEQPEKPQDNNSYDKDGYDRNGYDREGYDRQGYDRNGYDRYGYDRQGYDRDGYDREGYDREGYNRNGYDRYGERKDDNSQSGSPSGSGTWGDSSQANGAQSNPGTQNDNAVSPQDNGNGQGDSTGDGQGTPTTGEGEQGAGSGQGVGAGQDDNAQGQGETQTQTITVTAQELHAFGILPSTITTNNSGDGNKVGSSDIDPKAVEEELNKQARENNTGYTYTITSNGDGTYNLTRTRTTTVPFASDSNNGAGFIDWNSMPTPATLFDLENEINKRLNDPNYLLASTSGGGDDGGLGKLLELRYNLESGAYSNNYTKYYQDLYDAGLISELGFFGIPELDNFFNTNEFVNEDGSFNIDRYNELCQQYGINPDDYDISFSSDKTGNYVTGNVIILNKKDLSKSSKSIEFDKNTGEVTFMDSDSIPAPTLEEVKDMFLEGLNAIRASIEGGGYNPAPEIKFSTELQAALDKLSRDTVRIYIEENYMDGFYTAKSIADWIGGGTYGTDIDAPGGPTTYIKLDSAAIANYAMDMMDRDAQMGYDYFGQFLRMCDRLSALEHLSTQVWSDEALAIQEEMIMSDQIAHTYSWCTEEYNQRYSGEAYSAAVISTETTQTNNTNAICPISQRDALSYLQEDIIQQLSKELDEANYGKVGGWRLRRDYMGNPYLVSNYGGNKLYLDGGTLDDLKHRLGSCAATATFQHLMQVTNAIDSTERSIQLAQLDYLQSMAYYSTGDCTYEDLTEAKNNYLELKRQYESVELDYAFKMHDGGIITPNTSYKSYWNDFTGWYAANKKLVGSEYYMMY